MASFIISTTDETGVPAYRHLLAKDGFIDRIEPDCETGYDHFKKTVRLNGDKNFLGTRILNPDRSYGPYQYKTYKQVDAVATNISSAIQELQLAPPVEAEGQTFKFVGIFSKNREEWAITELACMMASVTVVPLYDTLTDEGIDAILGDTTAQTIFVSEELLKRLIHLKASGSHPYLRNIIKFEKPTEQEISAASGVGARLISFEDLLRVGQDHPHADIPPNRDDYYMMCYTSGTTGKPKGVMLTHKNAISVLGTVSAYGISIVPSDRHISYLPYAHMYEQIVFFAIFCSGASIGYYTGDARRLMDDIKELKPTLFVSVPRIYCRVFDSIQDKLSKKPKPLQWLVKAASWWKLRNLKKNGTFTSILDRFIFKNFKEALGGCCRLMATGSAPMESDIQNLLMVYFGCPLLEGYGQTESTGILTISPAGASTTTVGYPLPCLEIKLESIPEMKYNITDVDELGRPTPRGELCFRGNGRMARYFKRPDQNKETIDQYGWVHTGDVATLTIDRQFKIIDRKKNIFKLAQGEYIAPEKLENVFVQAPLVAQILVYGNSFKFHLVALVIPDFENLRKALPNKSDEELCSSVDAKKLIYQDLVKIAREQKIAAFEIPKQLHLHSELCTVENGLLTPTQKMVRNKVVEIHKEKLEGLYDLPLLA